MMQSMVLLFVISVALFFNLLLSFKLTTHHNQMMNFNQQRILKMEYIPDGLSKAQWEAMKKKEAEAVKGKDLGKVGITKFQSRSFEAWQKSGQGHLFPVDPKTPIDARPYMQRQGGSADGSDLKKFGIQGKDQAKASAKNEADLKYEQLEKEGKLKSTPFAVPWTSAQATKQFQANKQKDGDSSSSKSNITAKSSMKTATASTPAPSDSKKDPPKKLFGLF